MFSAACISTFWLQVSDESNLFKIRSNPLAFSSSELHPHTL